MGKGGPGRPRSTGRAANCQRVGSKFHLEPIASLVENDEPDRRYPCGNQIDKYRLSCDHTGIGSTSSGGCFSKGMRKYGYEDMVGNVWEPCQRLWQSSYNKYKREDNWFVAFLTAAMGKLKIVIETKILNADKKMVCGL